MSKTSSADPFDGLRRRLAGKTDSAALAAAIEDVATIKGTLQDRHAALSQARSDTMLTATPADLAASRAELGAIADALDVASAFRAKLTADHAAAAAAEEDARRRATYDLAAEMVAGATKTFGREYGKAARALTAAVTALMQAKVAAEEANLALPIGADPLADPEMALTCIPGVPRKVLSESTETVWCFADSFRPVAQQHRVATGGVDKNTGYLPPESGNAAGSIPVVLRTFQKRMVLPAIDAQWVEPITRTLAVPGWIAPPMRGPFALNAVAYLATIAEAVRAQDAAPAAPQPTKRNPVVELVPVDGDGVVREDQVLREFEVPKGVVGKAA